MNARLTCALIPDASLPLSGRGRGPRVGLGLGLVWSLLLWLGLAGRVEGAPPVRSTAYNGSGQVVHAHRPEYDATTNLTVEAWVFRRVANSFDTLVSHNWTRSYWFGVGSNNRLRFYRSGGVGFFKDSTQTVPAERWTHVAATYDGARVRFYIDGQAAGDEPLANAGINRSESLVLGGDVNGGLGLEGHLDEVRVWSVVRTQAEIQASRFRELTVAPGLVARFADGGRTNDLAGTVGAVTGASAQVWGILPRDYRVPAATVPVNTDADLSEFIAAGSERVVLRYRLAGGAERDVEGHLLYRSPIGDRNVYLAVPPTPGKVDSLSGLQPLWFSAMFAVEPVGATPQPGNIRVDSRADNVTAGVATNLLRRGNGIGWVNASDPAEGFASWGVVRPAECEFECGRVFRMPLSLMGDLVQPVRVLFGQFAYAVPSLFLPGLSLPSALDAQPDVPASWPRLVFEGGGPAVPRVTVTGRVVDGTRGGGTGLSGVAVRLLNPSNGTTLATVWTDGTGAFSMTAAVAPSNAPLRVSCDVPDAGVWRHLAPTVSGSALVLSGADPGSGVTYANPGLTADTSLGTVAFTVLRHGVPALGSVVPREGAPQMVLRTLPQRLTEPTRFTVSGANLHPFCEFHLSHVAGAAPLNPGDSLPVGPGMTNFPLRVVGRAADWSSVTLELDFPFDLRLNRPGEAWGGGPYRVVLRDTWVPAWRTAVETFRITDPPYPLVHGFAFENERDGTQFDAFSAVYQWNAYDCLVPPGLVLPPSQDCFGCRIPNPLYLTFHSLVFTPWVELMTGHCLGMSATSLLMARGELPAAGVDPLVRHPFGFTPLAPIPDVCDDCPPKPQEFRFRSCDYSEPVNVWAHIHRNQAIQTSAEFLRAMVEQMDGTGAFPLGARGYSIDGNPVRSLERIRGDMRGHLLCFQAAGDLLRAHSVVPYGITDDQGLDDATLRIPVAAPGRSLIHVYDPNWPGNPRRHFEINRTNNTYRYWFGLRPVVTNTPSGPVTNLVDEIWSGTAVYTAPVSIFRNGRTMPGSELLARGLALVLFGAADPLYRDRDGGQWGYDAAGVLHEGYPGGRALAPFGVRATPLSADRTAWFFPPAGRAPKEVLIRWREAASSKGRDFRLVSSSAGRLVALSAEGGLPGEVDRAFLEESGQTLAAIRYAPQGVRTNLQARFGLSRGTNPPLVVEYSGFRVGAGGSVQFRPLPDQSGIDFRNDSGEAARLTLRIFRFSTNQPNLDIPVLGPVLVPPGASHRLELAGLGVEHFRSALDLDGDTRYDVVTLLAPRPGVITQPADPVLRLEPGDGEVTVSWPVLAEPWILERTEVLADATLWQPVETPPRPAGDRQSVAVEVTETPQFFRLRRLPTQAMAPSASTTYEVALHAWEPRAGLRSVFTPGAVTNVLIRRRDGSVVSARPSPHLSTIYPGEPELFRTWFYFTFTSPVAPEDIGNVAFQGSREDGFHGAYVGVYPDHPDAVPRRLFELPILTSERPDLILLNTPGHTNWLPAKARNNPHLDRPYVTVEWTEESRSIVPPYNVDDRVIDWEDTVTTEIELTDGRTLVVTLDPPERRRPTWSRWPAPGYVDAADPIRLRDSVGVRRYSRTLQLPEPLEAGQIAAVRTYNGLHVHHEYRGFYDALSPAPGSPVTVSHHVDPGEALRTRRNLWMTWPTFSGRRVKLLAQEIFVGSTSRPKTSLMRFEEPADLVNRFIWQRELRPRLVPADARASIFAIQYLTGDDDMRTVPELNPDLQSVPWGVYELITRFTARFSGMDTNSQPFDQLIRLHFDTYFRPGEYVPVDLLPPGTPGRFSDANVLNRGLYLGIAGGLGGPTLQQWLDPIGPDVDLTTWPEHFWIIHNCNPRLPGTPFARNRTALALKSARRSYRLADLKTFELFVSPGRGADDLDLFVFGPMGPDEWHLRGLVISYRYRNAWRRLYADYRSDFVFREGARGNVREIDLWRQARVVP